MSKSGRAGTGGIIKLVFDGLLLLCFIFHALLLGCFFAYGYLPLPAKWVGEAITNELPTGITFRADHFSLTPDGTLRMENIQLHLDGIQEFVFKADYAHAEFGAQWDKQEPLFLKECVLSNGLLLLPAVYSPDGSDSAILERIALRLLPTEYGITVDTFAARHDDISLRGSINWTALEQARELTTLREKADLFFKQAANVLKQKQQFSRFIRPTIFFNIDSNRGDPINIISRLSSRSYHHPDIQAKNLILDAQLSLTNQTLVSTSSLWLKADEVQLPAHQARASSIVAKVECEELGSLLEGKWPNMEVMAEALDIKGIHLETPRIKLAPLAVPEIAFSGYTSGLQGAVEFSGTVNAETGTATMQAAGSLDLLSIAPENITNRLPFIKMNRPPYYNLELSFDEDFVLNYAALRTRVGAFETKNLRFNHIRFRGNYHKGVYSINRAYLRRDWQWLELDFNLDRSTDDYALNLKGYAIPSDYNAILPRWWEAIFREFDFEQTKSGLADFVIYGNTKEKATSFFFGHVTARNVTYKGVRVDKGELFVRGKGPYAEVYEIDARSGKGYARGDIRFASRLDEVRGPMSVRLNLDTQLPLSSAEKLFDKKIATIFSDFETDALPRTVLRGALFNKAYPQFDGLSHIDLSVTCPSPITYKGLSLNTLKFDLQGRKDITYLRAIEFGYAGGTAQASADILTAGDGSTQTRFHLSLKEADQGQAISQLNALKERHPKSETEKTTPGEGRLNLELHALAPVKNPLQMNGHGRVEIQNDALYAIQLFGPLSKLLQNVRLGFTSFALNEMKARFALKDGTVRFEQLVINGPRTRIEALGTMGLDDFTLAMRVSVHLFGNAGSPNSHIRKLSEFITRPIPNILEFELTGTPDGQNWRSLYDPRQFIPQF